jgi:hypothetical protein
VKTGRMAVPAAVPHRHLGETAAISWRGIHPSHATLRTGHGCSG